MGLILNVFKSSMGDCSNGGISAFHTGVCVVNVDGPFEPRDDTPAVKLMEGPFNSIRLVPVSFLEGKRHYMAGGSYAGTSDSRFGEAVEKMVGYRVDIVKLFDRME